MELMNTGVSPKDADKECGISPTTGKRIRVAMKEGGATLEKILDPKNNRAGRKCILTRED